MKTRADKQKGGRANTNANAKTESRLIKIL